MIEESHTRAVATFDELMAQSENTKIVFDPEKLFDDLAYIQKRIKTFDIAETGFRKTFRNTTVVEFKAKIQPSFNKNFEMLADELAKYKAKQYSCIIASEVPRQLERLQVILEQADPFMKFQPLYVSLRQGFIDDNQQILCYTEHQLFDRYHGPKQKDKGKKGSKALTLKELQTLSAGDYVTHIDYGVGRFAGLEKKKADDGRTQEAIRLIYRDNDVLLVSIHSLHKISKYSGKDSLPPQISKLGSPEWENKKKKVRRKLQDIAKDLINLYAKRKAAPGLCLRPRRLFAGRAGVVVFV